MPSIAGINHRAAIRALQKAGFTVAREGRRHVVLTDGVRFLTIPRNNLRHRSYARNTYVSQEVL
jgi:RimJ/RimL family protein N-acetyltransferase